MTPAKTLSVVVPVFNEETNVRPFYDAIAPVLDKLDCATELLFVDDGSRDGTFECIAELRRMDPRVRCLRFSRNFGSHPALMAGLRNCSGDAAVMMSVDLQDPPEVIPSMVEKWGEGAHVVWAVRESRSDPLLKKLFAASFYGLFRKIAIAEYPETGMDFGLFDRAVLNCLQTFEERNAFITGTIVWLGFKQVHVPYHRRPRHSGTTKWPFWRRLKAAIDAFIAFSYVPIRLISSTGIAVSMLSLLYASYIVYRKFAHGDAGAGWPSVMTGLLFLGGVQLVMLGILGEYLWRGVDQVRGRPQYIVMDSLGFSEEPAMNSMVRTKSGERFLDSGAPGSPFTGTSGTHQTHVGNASRRYS